MKYLAAVLLLALPMTLLAVPTDAAAPAPAPAADEEGSPACETATIDIQYLSPSLVRLHCFPPSGGENDFYYIHLAFDFCTVSGGGCTTICGTAFYGPFVGEIHEVAANPTVEIWVQMIEAPTRYDWTSNIEHFVP